MKREKWMYVVSYNDRYELPALVTDNAKEAASFLGITRNALFCHFCLKHASGTRGQRYKVERFIMEEE